MKPRFANIGNPALRQLYLGDTEPYTPPAEELVIPLNERKSIQTLTEASCRWPIGDPQLADFHFCGRKQDYRLALLRFPCATCLPAAAAAPPRPRGVRARGDRRAAVRRQHWPSPPPSRPLRRRRPKRRLPFETSCALSTRALAEQRGKAGSCGRLPAFFCAPAVLSLNPVLSLPAPDLFRGSKHAWSAPPPFGWLRARSRLRRRRRY